MHILEFSPRVNCISAWSYVESLYTHTNLAFFRWRSFCQIDHDKLSAACLVYNQLCCYQAKDWSVSSFAWHKLVIAVTYSVRRWSRYHTFFSQSWLISFHRRGTYSSGFFGHFPIKLKFPDLNECFLYSGYSIEGWISSLLWYDEMEAAQNRQRNNRNNTTMCILYYPLLVHLMNLTRFWIWTPFQAGNG